MDTRELTLLEEIQSYWKVPCIAHFCSLFRGVLFDQPDLDIEDLEDALIKAASPGGSPIIFDLICNLLEGIYGCEQLTVEDYDKYLKDLFNYHHALGHIKSNPLVDKTYFDLSLIEKVDTLHNLCDFRLESEDVMEMLKGHDGDNMRVEPLGCDRNGANYWYFYGTRLYQEDPPLRCFENETKSNNSKQSKTSKKKKSVKDIKVHKKKLREVKKEDLTFNTVRSSRNVLERKSKRQAQKVLQEISNGEDMIESVEEIDYEKQIIETTEISMKMNMDIDFGNNMNEYSNINNEVHELVNEITEISSCVVEMISNMTLQLYKHPTNSISKYIKCKNLEVKADNNNTEEMCKVDTKRKLKVINLETDCESFEISENIDNRTIQIHTADSYVIPKETVMKPEHTVVRPNETVVKPEYKLTDLICKQIDIKPAESDIRTRETNIKLHEADGTDLKLEVYDIKTDNTSLEQEQDKMSVKLEDIGIEPVRIFNAEQKQSQSQEPTQTDEQISLKKSIFAEDNMHQLHMVPTISVNLFKEHRKVVDKIVNQEKGFHTGETNGLKVDNENVKSKDCKKSISKPYFYSNVNKNLMKLTTEDSCEDTEIEIDDGVRFNINETTDVEQVKENSRWHMVCSTLEDWQNLSEFFRDSEAKCEKELYKIISEDFLPEIPNIIAERQKELTRRLIHNVPRRQSNRLEIKRIEQKEFEKIKAHQEIENEKQRILEEDKRMERVRQERIEEQKRAREEREKARVERANRMKKREERARLMAEGIEIPEDLRNLDSPVHEPEVKVKNLLVDNEVTVTMFKVLDSVKNHKDSWLFWEPVEESFAPGYFDVIKKPMDLMKIESKINNREYKTTDEFFQDFLLIFDNCILYNGTDSDFAYMANVLRNHLKKVYKKLMPNDDESIDDYRNTSFEPIMSDSQPTASPPVVKPKPKKKHIYQPEYEKTVYSEIERCPPKQTSGTFRHGNYMVHMMPMMKVSQDAIFKKLDKEMEAYMAKKVVNKNIKQLPPLAVYPQPKLEINSLDPNDPLVDRFKRKVDPAKVFYGMKTPSLSSIPTASNKICSEQTPRATNVETVILTTNPNVKRNIWHISQEDMVKYRKLAKENNGVIEIKGPDGKTLKLQFKTVFKDQSSPASSTHNTVTKTNSAINSSVIKSTLQQNLQKMVEEETVQKTIMSDLITNRNNVDLHNVKHIEYPKTRVVENGTALTDTSNDVLYSQSVTEISDKQRSFQDSKLNEAMKEKETSKKKISLEELERKLREGSASIESKSNNCKNGKSYVKSSSKKVDDNLNGVIIRGIYHTNGVKSKYEKKVLNTTANEYFDSEFDEEDNIPLRNNCHPAQPCDDNMKMRNCRGLTYHSSESLIQKSLTEKKLSKFQKNDFSPKPGILKKIGNFDNNSFTGLKHKYSSDDDEEVLSKQISCQKEVPLKKKKRVSFSDTFTGCNPPFYLKKQKKGSSTNNSTISIRSSSLKIKKSQSSNITYKRTIQSSKLLPSTIENTVTYLTNMQQKIKQIKSEIAPQKYECDFDSSDDDSDIKESKYQYNLAQLRQPCSHLKSGLFTLCDNTSEFSVNAASSKIINPSVNINEDNETCTLSSSKDPMQKIILTSEGQSDVTYILNDGTFRSQDSLYVADTDKITQQMSSVNNIDQDLKTDSFRPSGIDEMPTLKPIYSNSKSFECAALSGENLDEEMPTLEENPDISTSEFINVNEPNPVNITYNEQVHVNIETNIPVLQRSHAPKTNSSTLITSDKKYQDRQHPFFSDPAIISLYAPHSPSEVLPRRNLIDSFMKLGKSEDSRPNSNL